MNKNIIFIFSDQQRWDTMGVYGQKLDTTPNLDKLGKESTIFNNAFTCQPVCGPARASLQTGLYSSKTDVFVNAIPLNKNIKTIASYFSENGYQTAYGHNSKLLVDYGQKVKRGEKIALIGNTGRTTGIHCHFEIRVGGDHKNPMPYLSARF